MVDSSEEMNPLQRHLQARVQVDPSKPSAHNEYTMSAAESPANEEVHFRVLRLEQEMEGLKSDFKKLLPPLSNLIVSDKELDKTIEQIETRQQTADSTPVNTAGLYKKPVHKPEMEKAMKVRKASAPPPKSGGPLAVSAVRVGEHPGKTRMVLDTTGTPKFTYDLDNTEHLLVINLPGSGWSAATQKTFKSHPLIQSYTAQDSGNGTSLVIELKKSARVVYSSTMAPNHVHGHRVVFDVAAQ